MFRILFFTQGCASNLYKDHVSVEFWLITWNQKLRCSTGVSNFKTLIGQSRAHQVLFSKNMATSIFVTLTDLDGEKDNNYNDDLVNIAISVASYYCVLLKFIISIYC